LPVKFVFDICKTKGIPFARNCILDYADSNKFDYCLFLDDDETADPKWISNLQKAHQNSNAPIIQGQVLNHYESTPWLYENSLKKHKFSYENLCQIYSVSTCNVSISAEIYSENNLNLRFDERYALTGGSDKDFFRRAIHELSIKAFFSENALVTEHIPSSRTTIQWHFLRHSRLESNAFLKYRHQQGYLIAIIKKLPRTLLSILTVLIHTVFAIFTCINAGLLRKNILHILKHTARIWGNTCSMFGRPVLAYKKTTGQ